MTNAESGTDFEFEVVVDSGDGRESDASRSSGHARDDQTPAATAARTDSEPGDGTVTAETGDVHRSLAVTSDLSSFEQLGAALYYYEVDRLAVLVDRIADDSNPPAYAEAILPWVERYVET